MLRKSLFLSALYSALSFTGLAQPTYQERVTSVSNIGMTISNIGLVGNAFRGNFNLNNQPSVEYPVNSGIECAFQGGLWVGARVNGADFRVSTGYNDSPSGYSTGANNFEFTVNPGVPYSEVSSLLNSPNFNPTAISHQDFRSTFTDRNIIVPGTSIPVAGHTPMGIDVDMETYNWNFDFANFFVVAKFTIRNVGNNVLDSVFVGYLTNGVIRNNNFTPAGQGGTAYFDKGGNAFIDSLNMSYDFDATGDVGFTNVYFAQKFLGAEDRTGFRHPKIDPNFKNFFQCWQFQSTANLFFGFPNTEQLRYDKLSSGLNFNNCWNGIGFPGCANATVGTFQQQLNRAGNRSNLNSVGPFATMNPGDEIVFYYAFIFAPYLKSNSATSTVNDNRAEERVKLIENAEWVQTAFYGNDRNGNGILEPDEDDGSGKIKRFILPSPPDIPKTKVVPTENRIDIYWTDNSLKSIDPISQERDFEGFRLYLTKVGFDVEGTQNLEASLTLLASYDSSGNKIFFDNGFNAIRLPEPIKLDGDSNLYHFKYTINNIQSGWQHVISLTSFDRGDPANNVGSLESSKLSNLFRVFPGKPANGSIEKSKPFVYPNPYYGGASWEGQSIFAEDRKLMFANLPARCKIKIFTTNGAMIDEFEHFEGYNGTGSRWFETFSNTKETVFSGGEHAWDLLSKNQQIIARGIYLFTVEDLETGEAASGQFAIIK